MMALVQRARRMSRQISVLLVLGMAALTAPAVAQESDPDPIRFDGLVEVRAIESDLEFDQGEGIDSSGFGARARLGVDFDLSETTHARVEAEGRVFDFRDEDRDSLETFVGRAQVTHQVSKEIEVRAHVRRFENIAVLEAFSADQLSIGARVQWDDGKNRVRVNGEYRERDYDTAIGGDSDGFNASIEYNRRLGSYHWLRLDLRVDENTSLDEPIRSYDRRIARLRYSVPIAKRLRFRPSIEYREWDFPDRVARGDAEGDPREDSFVAPGVGLSWGRTRGLYATGNVEYRIRQSNDIRFDNNAIRVGVRLGYRF